MTASSGQCVRSCRFLKKKATKSYFFCARVFLLNYSLKKINGSHSKSNCVPRPLPSRVVPRLVLIRLELSLHEPHHRRDGTWQFPHPHRSVPPWQFLLHVGCVQALDSWGVTGDWCILYDIIYIYIYVCVCCYFQNEVKELYLLYMVLQIMESRKESRKGPAPPLQLHGFSLRQATQDLRPEQLWMTLGGKTYRHTVPNQNGREPPTDELLCLLFSYIRFGCLTPAAWSPCAARPAHGLGRASFQHLLCSPAAQERGWEDLGTSGSTNAWHYPREVK